MEQKKEFVPSNQVDWDRVKIRSTKYLFCYKIPGLLENSYHYITYFSCIMHYRANVQPVQNIRNGHILLNMDGLFVQQRIALFPTEAEDLYGSL